MKVLHGNTCDAVIVKSRAELEIVGEYLVKAYGYTQNDFTELGFASFRHLDETDVLISVEE